MTVYLNGRYLPFEEAVISPGDRGFLFSDGVYEVVRSVEGRFFLLDEHLQRLLYGLRELRMEELCLPLEEIGTELLRSNGLEQGEAMLYLQVTRGVSSRSHRLPPAGTAHTVYAFAKAMPDIGGQCRDGIGVVIVEDLRWSRCDIKTIGLLANSLAYEHAHESGAKEAVFVRDGQIVEGAHTNVFFVRDNELVTPPEGRAMLSGVTRKAVMALAMRRNIPLVVRPVGEGEASEMDEIFLTGTTSDVTPVVRWNETPAGSGEPGPVTRLLQSALREEMDDTRVPLASTSA